MKTKSLWVKIIILESLECNPLMVEVNPLKGIQSGIYEHPLKMAFIRSQGMLFDRRQVPGDGLTEKAHMLTSDDTAVDNQFYRQKPHILPVEKKQ
mgnify:CR=1 FL=1